MTQRPQRFTDAEATIDWLVATAGRDLRVAAPLGLGKPATLMNALYARARDDPSICLSILTALSLDLPAAGSDLEQRLMGPIADRIFEDYPGLDFIRDQKAGALPDNVSVSEFFFAPGAMLGNTDAQRHYRSVNYTHAARDIMDSGVNVFMQMSAPGPDDGCFSLSSNTDVTLDLIPVVEAARAAGRPLYVVGQLNERMPMMTRSALVDAGFADAVFVGEAANFKPFGAPAMPVSATDYAIALRVSTLLADGGTLQIGIGSLSDAIAYCCDLRHNHNADYRELVAAMNAARNEPALIDSLGGMSPFERGLYGCTEMLVDAYIQMYRAGVIKRVVYDDVAIQTLLDDGRIGEQIEPDTLTALVDARAVRLRLDADDVAWLKRFGLFHASVQWQDDEQLDPGDGDPLIAANLGDRAARAAVDQRCLGSRLKGATVIHGGFFLGPDHFYEALRELDDDQRELFHMTSVGQINHLYGDEALRRVQRRHARFVNTAIKATLSGAIASDGLENQQVLSGVGGQYDFVAQAHALTDARSIICVRAVRPTDDGPESNIVARYAHTTIPRHLRDIVVTEYGVADLRGKTDEQVAMAMIEIADARFQEELRASAIAAGKLRRDYVIPASARANTPEHIAGLFAESRRAGRFPTYPNGSEFSETERTLIAALKTLQGGSPGRLASRFVRHAMTLATIPTAAEPYLERMDLLRPRGWRESIQARLVTLALIDAGAIAADAEDAEATDGPA